MVVWVLYVLIFIAGLFIGSFLNVVSDRIVSNRSFFLGRSVCEFCSKVLSALELIPVFSFLLQRGACKNCKKKLSWYYPISEVLTGFVFAVAAYKIGIFSDTATAFTWLYFVFLIVVLSVYVVLLLTDLKYLLLPNKVLFPAILVTIAFLVLGMVLSLYYTYQSLNNDTFGKYLIKAGYWDLQWQAVLKDHLYILLSAIGIGVFFWLLTLIKNGRAMGGGDVKLAFLIGLVNGFPHNVFAIFLGFLFGALLSILLVWTKRKTIKDTVPFGPFLLLGSFVMLFWGDMLIDWYFGLF